MIHGPYNVRLIIHTLTLSFTLIMEPLIFSETLVSFYQTIQQHILREDSILSPVWELKTRLLKRTIFHGSLDNWTGLYINSLCCLSYDSFIASSPPKVLKLLLLLLLLLLIISTHSYMSASPFFMVIPSALNPVTLVVLALKECGKMLKYGAKQSEIQS